MSIISKIDDFLKKETPKKRQVTESKNWELNEEYELDDVLNKMVNFIAAIDRDVLGDEGRAMADEIMDAWNSGDWAPALNKAVYNHQSTAQPTNLNVNATMDVPDEESEEEIMDEPDLAVDDFDNEIVEEGKSTKKRKFKRLVESKKTKKL
jgi:hypothetical protein